MRGSNLRSAIASPSPDFCPGARSVWLGSPLTIIRDPSPRRVRNIFICMAVAFCASSKRMAALDSVRHAGLDAPFDHAPIHEVIERVIDGTQIRIDLVAHIARQEAEALAGLDRGTR